MFTQIDFNNYIPAIIAIGFFVSFWSIMLTQKNGPDFLIFKGGLFKFIRIYPSVVGFPVFLAILITLFFFLTKNILISIIVSCVIQFLSYRLGVIQYFCSFIGHVLECSACTATWFTAITLLLIFGFSLKLAILIPATIAFSFFIMSMCGVNNLRDL